MVKCRCGNRLDSKGYCHECQQYDISDRSKDYFEKQCPICRQLFKDLYCYMEHLKSHPQCNYCQERFLSKGALNIHLDSSHKCSFCDEYYSSLSEHLSWNHPYCHFCNKSFLDRILFEKHMKAHPQCIYCDENFKDNTSLYKHVQEIHKCHVCLKYFADVSNHSRLNHPFCRLCNRYFIDEKQYEWHSNQEHAHRCIYCNTYFKIPEELEEHVKCAHKCRFCKTHYTNLQQHFIEKHFYCKRCKMLFFSKSDYEAHMKSHEYTEKVLKHIGEERKEAFYKIYPEVLSRRKIKDPKTINCPFCNKKFTHEEAKIRHIKEVHPNLNIATPKITKINKQIKCPLCRKKFATEDAKNQHPKAAHPHST